MKCDECGRSTATVNELTSGEWVCDRCALMVWATEPETLTGGVAVVRETLRDARQDVFAARGRAIKAGQLVAEVRRRGAEADAPNWTRPQWLELAVELGVNQPSADTVRDALDLLARPRQMVMEVG